MAAAQQSPTTALVRTGTTAVVTGKGNTRFALSTIIRAAKKMIVQMYVDAYWKPIWKVVTESRKAAQTATLKSITDALGPGGDQNDGCPTLLTLCNGRLEGRKRTGRLYKMHNVTGTNTLIEWMLSKPIVAEAGFDSEFVNKMRGKDAESATNAEKGKRWIFRNAYRWLLREIVRTAVKTAINDNMIMDSSGRQALVELTQFRPGRAERKGQVLILKTEKGVGVIEANAPKPIYVAHRPTPIVKMNMRVGNKRVDVHLARLTTGLARNKKGEVAGYIPAILPDGRGGFTAGHALHCVFFWGLNPMTLKRSQGRHERLMGFPIGLVPSHLLKRYATAIGHPDNHRGRTDDEIRIFVKANGIPYIPNTIGSGNEAIVLTPKGLPSANGLTILKGEGDVDFKQGAFKAGADRWIAMLADKPARLRDGKINVVNSDGRPKNVPHLFDVEELPGEISLTVRGPADVMKQVVDGAIKHARGSETIPRALELLGLNLHTSALGIQLAIAAQTNTPPTDGLMARKIVEAGDNTEEILTTWQGILGLVRASAEAELADATQHLLKQLTMAGPQSGGRPSLQEICGGDPTPEVLSAVWQCRESNPVIDWIINTKAAQSLGITQWQPGSGILKKVAQTVIEEMARIEGITILKKGKKRRKTKKPQGGDNDNAEPTRGQRG